MAHAIWKGNISFGLVSIPVALHSATERDDLEFTMLDRRDLSPVGYERVSKKTGKPVPWEEVVKGHKYDGDYVVLTDEDFERANVEATHTVDIVDFVDQAEIEPIYFDQPYYLVPPRSGKKQSVGNIGNKGYVLLRETLSRTGKVGIAKVVIRAREHLAAVMVRGRLLLLDLLRFHHEIREPEGFELGAEPKISEAELRMAERLVGEMTGPWKPERYRDEYREDLLAVIERKAETGETEAAAELPRERRGTGKVVDLMPLLKQSLEARKEEPDESRGRRRKAKGSRERSPRRTGRARKSA